MITTEHIFPDMINKTSREIKGRVELLEGSTLLQSFTYKDNLQTFKIDRQGDINKFFGYGICQKLIVNLQDKERTINIKKGQKLDVSWGVASDYLYTTPVFFVDEIQRNENTNELTVTAYDAIYKAANHKVNELSLPRPYTLYTFILSVAALLGMPIKLEGITPADFNTSYPEGGNFDGVETLREALDDVAEATGTIYFMDKDWNLVFKKLDIDGDPVLTIDKSKYFTLSEKTPYTLSKITHATELGDNVTIGDNSGAHQYVRDNAFLANRTDISELLTNLYNRVKGLTSYQFDLSWRGDFTLELGDKIAIEAKNGDMLHSYMVNDVITYNGGLKQQTQWQFTPSENETASNPSNLGEALNLTFAKVDKVNKQIELVVSETESVNAKVSTLQLDIDSVKASVSRTEQITKDSIAEMGDSVAELNEGIASLTTKVEAGITAEDVQIEIKKELSNGTDKVITSTGYVFDDTGLSVSKTGSEMTTLITEDGMQIFKNNSAVLTANNKGVDAANLHATTYLIIGTNSRFEDFGNRTACFWIGR